MSFFEKLGFTTPKEEVVPKKLATVVQMNVPVANISINSEDNSKYSKILEDALEKRNIPGPDFLEFYKTLKIYATQPLPEPQKYTLAFGGLSVMGLTKDKIIETSSTYLKEIDNVNKEFEKSMQQFQTNEIDNKNKELQKLTQENIELQAKIQENLTNISKLNIEIAQNSQTLATKTATFNNTVVAEKASIETIITNVKNYL